MNFNFGFGPFGPQISSNSPVGGPSVAIPLKPIKISSIESNEDLKKEVIKLINTRFEEINTVINRDSFFINKDDKNREIIYIRYDDKNMKYVYLFYTCDTVWKTEEKS